MIYPVILCGGSGTRLWPSSRRAFPKQFGRLIGEDTLFQSTLKRLTGPEFAAPLVMTNADFRFIVMEQCADIGLADAQVVIEPALRNTAPAILCAALLLEETPDALMLVAPSDHIISGRDIFQAAIRVGAEAAAQGHLVTFGVTPDRPETAYGYLELTAAPTDGQAVALTSFTEKPDAETAAQFVAGGRHLWNAGLFLWRVCDILAAFEAHAPDMMAPCRAAVATRSEDLGFLRLGEDAFAPVRAASIDYAVMEQAEGVMAVPLGCGWSDLGSWDALWAASGPDEGGLVQQGNTTALDCQDSFLRSEDDNLHLVGVGLKNIVAVAMRDAVLVADMGAAQQVKEAVALLKAASAEQATNYPRFYRPWGWYETLCLGARFQVKRIMVKPHGRLSLQSHLHRSEHWIVVAGTAEVTIGEEVQLVTENQSVYIPLGTQHRLANPGHVPMYLIEVQTGAYLGEDDIQRHDDIYNRP
ncbi:mannose-1-phosphate guanylyltransferase/mannose-6-phosphate isomerase [Roseobacter cerasinus]|uniref:mannose-1-phosphate guanylyltransferase n=1 Tax=Roseobacter cerasinus TaxID=2602289 RepID=A0A640VZX3_9RHOB|nr:mannose-1-phosphate guanylyltransferase/mannose-6-phosphate isomerase [Roseobacter cerasinus]GFE52475.1 mannose-1-phosphate guanylyltransferase/mannose-6-phosphate isomerase [Roseobacter cerasinus]